MWSLFKMNDIILFTLTFSLEKIVTRVTIVQILVQTMVFLKHISGTH